MEEEKRKKGKGKIVIIVIVLIALAAAGFCIWMVAGSGNSNGSKVTTISESTLKEVLEISELSTASYTYNAVTDAYTKDGKTLKYHVAYDGTVKAGIDFEDVEIDVDDTAKTIKVKVPDAKILDVLVDEGTLEYIFEKEKYNTAEVSAQAYKLCLKDLKKKANAEEKLLTMAKDNAVSAVDGLIRPWVEQADESYTLTVE